MTMPNPLRIEGSRWRTVGAVTVVTYLVTVIVMALGP